MSSFLLAAAVIAGLVLIVPLAAWGGSGSWRAGLRALKEYLFTMFVIAVIPVTLALLTVLADILNL